MTKKICERYPFMSYLPKLKIVMEGTELLSVKPVIDEDGVITNQSIANVNHISRIHCSGKFIKLMTDHMNLLVNLNASGTRMFFIVAHITQESAMNKAYIRMDYQDAKSSALLMGFDLTKNSFYRGLDQLVDCDVIAKANSGSRYWINVGVLFNGDISQLPEIMNADPVFLAENGLAKIFHKKVKKG